MAIDLKTETPDTTLPSDGFLFGADSQSTAAPSVYTLGAVAGALVGGSSGQLQYNDGSAFAGMAGTAWDNTTRSLTITGATVTTSSPVLNLSQTWNNGATVFTGFRHNVTDTASAAGSLLFDWQVDGVTFCSFRPDTGTLRVRSANQVVGRLELGGDVVLRRSANNTVLAVGGIDRANLTNTSFALSSALSLAWSGIAAPDGTLDLFLNRDAADTLAQRRGTNAQTSRIYNTFTDASNYERLALFYSGNTAFVGHQAAGTGNIFRQLSLFSRMDSGAVTSGIIISDTFVGFRLLNSIGLNAFIITRETADRQAIKVNINSSYGWSGTTRADEAQDTGLFRSSVGVVRPSSGTSTGQGYFRMGVHTVAGLTAAGTVGEGTLAWVTDANATTPRSVVAGGGSDKVLVMSDGANWLIVA